MGNGTPGSDEEVLCPAMYRGVSLPHSRAHVPSPPPPSTVPSVGFFEELRIGQGGAAIMAGAFNPKAVIPPHFFAAAERGDVLAQAGLGVGAPTRPLHSSTLLSTGTHVLRLYTPGGVAVSPSLKDP